MGWVLPSSAEVSLAQILWVVAMGLVIGSFVNVLIHRLPIMILRADESDSDGFNLLTPRSHCPHCLQTLRWYELIPVVSYCLSLGRCNYCNQTISSRYP
jgi:leader peptidase (prepilin peptidase)/N-methyltransferase